MDKKILNVARDIFIICSNDIPLMLGYLVLKALVCREMQLPYGFRAGISLVLPLLIFYGYRELIKPAYLQLILHLATGILYVYLFSQDVFDMVFLTIVTGAMVAHSLYLKSKAESMKAFHLAFSIGALIIEYLVAFGEGTIEKSMIAICMIVGIVLYLLQHYIGKYFWFIVSRKSVNEAIPEKEILDSGMKYTGLFVGCMAILLCLITQMNKLEMLGKQLVLFLRNVLAAILRFIFGFFPESSTPDPIWMQEPEKAQDAGIMEMATTESNKIWQLIFQIFAVIVMLAVIVGIIYLIRKGFLTLISALEKEKRTITYLQERVEVEHTEKLKKDRQKRYTDQEGFWILTPEQKLRKIYRQVILFHGKGSILKEKKIYEDPTKTAQELLSLFDEEQRKEALELTKLYELARYDAQSITARHVKRAKELAQQLSARKR